MLGLPVLRAAGLRVRSLQASAPARTLMANSTTSRCHARLFHHTPPRRLFETTDQVLAAVIGFGAAWVLARTLPRFALRLKYSRMMSCPPMSWLNFIDQPTRDGVLAAVSAGFKLARSRPTKSNEALRQATFALPYEIARLNKDAPTFRIEDMGPCAEFPPQAQEVVDTMMGGWKPNFDSKQETRIFLYYPENASKATAAFLVINAEIEVPDVQKPHTINDLPPKSAAQGSDVNINPVRNLIPLALNLWINQYGRWKKDSKTIIENKIAPGQLPIIFCLREKCSGSVFDQELAIFPHPYTAALVMGLVEPESKSSD